MVEPELHLHVTMQSFYLLVGLCVVQVAVWWKLYDINGPLLGKHLKALVHRIPGGAQRLRENFEPMIKAFQMTYPDDHDYADDWVFSVMVFLHHTTGTVLCYMGYLWGWTTVFLVGLSFEIGEDVLHYLQMLYTKLVEPIEPFKGKPAFFYVFMFTHHLLGLVAGSIAHLYLSDWPDVQLLCTVLLSAGVPAYLNLPLMPFANIHEPCTAAYVNMTLSLFSFGFIIYTRFVLFFPLCAVILRRVHADISPGVYYALLVPLVVFTLFNLMSFVCMGLALVHTFRELWQSPESKFQVATLALERCTSFSNPPSPARTAHFHALERAWIREKLHSLARDARDRVAKNGDAKKND